eukprot:Colp12_sorted_trinity150504_noHs@5397
MAALEPVVDDAMEVDGARAGESLEEKEIEEYFAIKKRVPPRMPAKENDIYVCRTTQFPAQFEKAKKLLDSGYDEINIHGLGAAINRAINLGLQLKERYLDTLEVSATTSTVALVDDLEPLKNNVQPKTRVRNNSAIHVKVSRKGKAAV